VLKNSRWAAWRIFELVIVKELVEFKNPWREESMRWKKSTERGIEAEGLMRQDMFGLGNVECAQK
jgi:hypothetical protein